MRSECSKEWARRSPECWLVPNCSLARAGNAIRRPHNFAGRREKQFPSESSSQGEPKTLEEGHQPAFFPLWPQTTVS